MSDQLAKGEEEEEDAGMADKVAFTIKLAELVERGELSLGAALMANRIVSPALFAKLREINSPSNGVASPSEPAPGE